MTNHVRRYSKLVVALAIFMLLSLITITFVTAVYVYRFNPQPADAIVVFGASAYHNGNYNPCLLARVDQAVQLHTQALAPKILMTGGLNPEDNAIEAAVMQQIAVELGASSSAILLESRATSTYENVAFSNSILEEQNLDSVILVTEGFHMFRAAAVANGFGWNYTIAPTNESPCWQRWRFLSRFFLREPLVTAYYLITGKLF